MLEKIQNKFTRFLYLKQHGVYPYYPLMYPSLFVIGMVGYSRLRVRRDVALVTYVWRVLRGMIHHPEVLMALQLCAPTGVVGARRKPPLLLELTHRTNLMYFAPIARAVRILNLLAPRVDVFGCTVSKFTEAAYSLIESLNKVTADTRRADAFDLRHGAHQLRNETRIKTEWDSYHNNNRLRARVYEIEQWKSTLQELLDRIDREMNSLKEEKASTERELEQLNLPLLVCSECLSNRDGRRSTELTYDLADTELKKELCVTESNKKMLIDRCQSAWEKINKLEVVKFKLQLDLNDKNEALQIDKDMLGLDKDCANITYKTDSLKTPKRMITGEQWLEKCEATKRMAIDELQDTLRLRESLFVARGRARNALRAQTDVTNYMLRRRIYDTQRARNELDWQRLKMEENMDKLAQELKTMGEQFADKVNALKVAETRLETRGYRPGTELASDEADIGLKEEVRNLRETIRQLQEKLDCAKATYNALEAASIKISQDLQDKNQSLETDTRALEMRAALEPKKPQGTDKNLVLASMADEVPKVDV